MSDDYKAGNTSDLIKHSNLVFLARLLQPQTYVEFHSGPGYGRTKEGNRYDGSALRVLPIQKIHRHHHAYLHEKDDDRRESLEKAVRGYNADVRGQWQDSIDEYLRQADDTWLFLLDPTSIHDYKTLVKRLPALQATGASLFLYVPQLKRSSVQQRIVKRVYDFLDEPFADLRYPTPQGGYHERIEHNIIVAPPPILHKATRNHDTICRRVMEDFATFQKFKPLHVIHP